MTSPPAVPRRQVPTTVLRRVAPTAALRRTVPTTVPRRLAPPTPTVAPPPPVPTAAELPRPGRRVLLGAAGVALVGGLTVATVVGLPSANHTSAASVTHQAVGAVPPRDTLQFPLTPVAAWAKPVRASRSRAIPPRSHITAPVAAWVVPCSGPITSPYGPRWGVFHDGIDFGPGFGAPIHAVADGVVIGAGYLDKEGGYGQLTLVRHAGGIVSAYAHQSRMVVQAGDHVKTGEVIGYVGSTGHSTGPHLHFEIRTSTHAHQINPSRWLLQYGVKV